MNKAETRKAITKTFIDMVIANWGDKVEINDGEGGAMVIDIEGYETFEYHRTYETIDSWGSMRGKSRKNEHDVVVKELENILKEAKIKVNNGL